MQNQWTADILNLKIPCTHKKICTEVCPDLPLVFAYLFNHNDTDEKLRSTLGTSHTCPTNWGDIFHRRTNVAFIFGQITSVPPLSNFVRLASEKQNVLAKLAIWIYLREVSILVETQWLQDQRHKCHNGLHYTELQRCLETQELRFKNGKILPFVERQIHLEDGLRQRPFEVRIENAN